MGSFQSFEELACWKEARNLRNFVRNLIIKNFPNSERFELTSQIKRSARSVGNNIAEGFGRYNFQENIQFCRIARGSLNETLDHAIIALDESYISKEDLKELRVIHDKTLLILNGYIKYLKGQKNKK
ncbi:MAG: four helix bundle protein [Flavobacteriaceae bacterium]|nr:four helix bundle protein [Flavobacteriaceae bacterium]